MHSDVTSVGDDAEAGDERADGQCGFDPGAGSNDESQEGEDQQRRYRQAEADDVSIDEVVDDEAVEESEHGVGDRPEVNAARY